MADKDYPLTREDYDAIYSKVTRLTVEILIQNDQGAVYMTQRAVEPCIGQWHLPGGTVLYGEKVIDAVKRVAQRELGINIVDATNSGYIEYPTHVKSGLGSPVGMVFVVNEYDGEIRLNGEALQGGWFTSLPENMHSDQDVYLIGNGYLTH